MYTANVSNKTIKSKKIFFSSWIHNIIYYLKLQHELCACVMAFRVILWNIL